MHSRAERRRWLGTHIVFALKRDGSLLGLPRITHSRLVGDADAQKAFVTDAVRALAKCLPVSITDGLGGAIAGAAAFNSHR